jgi:hypothetical protein
LEGKPKIPGGPTSVVDAPGFYTTQWDVNPRQGGLPRSRSLSEATSVLWSGPERPGCSLVWSGETRRASFHPPAAGVRRRPLEPATQARRREEPSWDPDGLMATTGRK